MNIGWISRRILGEVSKICKIKPWIRQAIGGRSENPITIYYGNQQRHNEKYYFVNMVLKNADCFFGAVVEAY
jgi:hypothetical protein